MAASVPASLKSAGIIPFATRAAQIEKVKPAVAYWCNYWIVQQIVTKGLHNSDEESKTYTATLMDKLEAAKSEHASEDAITDDIAAKAYLEQFGLEVFNRADNAIRNNKASKQTADTFQAAYTFLELLQIWPPLDPEIAAKIKFAKYHALRIAKAVKAGEDPNLSNPAPEPEPTHGVPPLDPNDPEVQALGGLGSPSTTTHQPSVQDIPDEHHQASPSMARASSLDQSLHPSRAPSAQVTGVGPTAPPQAPAVDTSAEGYYRSTDTGDVSPLAPSTHDRANSEGGGYFPSVSQPPTGPSTAFTPGQPTGSGQAFGSPSAPAPISPLQPSPPGTLPQAAPQYPHQPPAQSYTIAPNQFGNGPATAPHAPMPYQAPPPGSHQPPQQPQPMWSGPQSTIPSRAQPQSQPPPAPQATNFRTDDEAVSKAQKHARWAISALNFEDVKTAVSELQKALETLGAR